jgi:hypothetical protein
MTRKTLQFAGSVISAPLSVPSGVMARMKEYTSAYGRAGVGGTDFLSESEQPFVLQAGVQISIPLASTKERREHAPPSSRLGCRDPAPWMV